jgi:hypothetical protein
MRAPALAMFLIAASLGGCDVLYGVRRQATLESMPPLECVAAVVSSAPGVISVEKEAHSGGTAITLSGLKKPASSVHSFVFRGSNASHIQGVLQVHQDHTGKIVFANTLLSINVRPPQEQVDATRAVMKGIEATLERDCGMSRLSADISEKCRGVVCQSMQ